MNLFYSALWRYRGLGNRPARPDPIPRLQRGSGKRRPPIANRTRKENYTPGNAHNQNTEDGR